MIEIPGLTSEPDYGQMLRDSIVSVHDVIEKPSVCLEICRNGINSIIGTLGNISLLIGKAKQGKTFAVSMALAAAINQSGIFQDTLRASLPADQKQVLFFDTEQGQYHVHRVIKRICTLLNIPEPTNLTVYALRKYPPAKRLSMIEYAIYNTNNVGLVIIDGIRDLVSSINDEEQATSIASDLLRWTAEKNIHVQTVLHMNKGDQNARGHIGTELQNKAETVISIGKDSSDKEIIIIQPEFTRDKDFDPIAFKIDEHGLPYFLMDWAANDKSKRNDRLLRPDQVVPETHADLLRDIFSVKSEMIRSELKTAAKANLSRWMLKEIGLNKVDEWIHYWQQFKQIILTGTPGTKSAKYRNNSLIAI